VYDLGFIPLLPSGNSEALISLEQASFTKGWPISYYQQPYEMGYRKSRKKIHVLVHTKGQGRWTTTTTMPRPDRSGKQRTPVQSPSLHGITNLTLPFRTNIALASVEAANRLKNFARHARHLNGMLPVQAYSHLT
jgi:hypothetical protein